MTKLEELRAVLDAAEAAWAAADAVEAAASAAYDAELNKRITHNA